jgi:hypothetical protein
MNSWNIEAAFPNRHFDITPSNTVPLPRPMILYCVADGDVVVEDKDGTQITYSMVVGQVLPLQVEKVRATGTSASVVGLF